MIQESVNKDEEKSYKDPLTMTAEEYLEQTKKVMEEDEKLTDEELMEKYRIW